MVGSTGLLPASPPEMGALTQGLPPPKPPHRPNPTPCVPGRVNVRICKAKDKELSRGDGGRAWRRDRTLGPRVS